MRPFQSIVLVELREIASWKSRDIVRFQVRGSCGQCAPNNLLHLTRVQVYARSEFGHTAKIEVEFLEVVRRGSSSYKAVSNILPFCCTSTRKKGIRLFFGRLFKFLHTAFRFCRVTLFSPHGRATSNQENLVLPTPPKYGLDVREAKKADA
jgi:hypothetical protein